MVFNRSAEQRRAMFARMFANRFSSKSVSSQFGSYSDFNIEMNKKFHEGIPSMSDLVLTDKNMEMKHPPLANLVDMDRNHFSMNNKFATGVSLKETFVKDNLNKQLDEYEHLIDNPSSVRETIDNLSKDNVDKLFRYMPDTKFAEAPTDAYKYNVISAVEGAISEYDSNLQYFKKYGITKDDVIAIKVGKVDAISKASSSIPVQGQSVQPIVQNTNAWVN